MLKTFALLAFVWNPVTGQADTYVLDSGMSGEDCIAVLMDVEAVEVEPGRVLPTSEISLACELERA